MLKKKRKKAQTQIGSVIKLHSQELMEEGLKGRCFWVGACTTFSPLCCLLLCYAACLWLTS